MSQEEMFAGEYLEIRGEESFALGRKVLYFRAQNGDSLLITDLNELRKELVAALMWTYEYGINFVEDWG